MRLRLTPIHCALVLALIGSACGASTPEPAANPGAVELAVDDDATVSSLAPTSSEPTDARSTEAPPADTPTSDAPTTTIATTTPTTTAAATTIPSTPLEQVSLDLELIATLRGPVGVASRPGSADLYVIEQQGRLVRLPDASSEGADVALDLRGSVSGGNEQGLLGAAFTSDGATLFVNYTDNSGTTVISRYPMVGTGADSAGAEVILTIPQPRGNHNGGQLSFGPDGYLYVGTGDGGGGGDPELNGQNTNTLLGSILRIDVSGPSGYTVPPDNPFLDGAAPEVFIWGIRNAWRFGFDSATGDLWIGDVGQDRFEEVTVLRAADGGGNGANLGWNQVEGTEPFRSGTIPANHVAPVITYGHSGERCSITGGEVYRGNAVGALFGTYLYGDFCTGEVFGYRVDESSDPVRLDLPAVDRLSSFGLDADGELLVVSGGGGIYRITG